MYEPEGSHPSSTGAGPALRRASARCHGVGLCSRPGGWACGDVGTPAIRGRLQRSAGRTLATRVPGWVGGLGVWVWGLGLEFLAAAREFCKTLQYSPKQA